MVPTVESTEVLAIIDEVTDLTNVETHRLWFEREANNLVRLCHMNAEEDFFLTILDDGDLEELLSAINFSIHQMDYSRQRSRASHIIMILVDTDSFDRMWFERPIADAIYLCVWRHGADNPERIWIGDDELGKLQRITQVALKWYAAEVQALSQPDTHAQTTPEEAPPDVKAVKKTIEVGSTVQVRNGVHFEWVGNGEVTNVSGNGYTVKLSDGEIKFYARINVRLPIQ